MGNLAQGGSILTLEGHGFDAEECLAAIDRWKANGLAIVGDAFAKPSSAPWRSTPNATTSPASSA